MKMDSRAILLTMMLVIGISTANGDEIATTPSPKRMYKKGSFFVDISIPLGENFDEIRRDVIEFIDNFKRPSHEHGYCLFYAFPPLNADMEPKVRIDIFKRLRDNDLRYHEKAVKETLRAHLVNRTASTSNQSSQYLPQIPIDAHRYDCQDDGSPNVQVSVRKVAEPSDGRNWYEVVKRDLLPIFNDANGFLIVTNKYDGLESTNLRLVMYELSNTTTPLWNTSAVGPFRREMRAVIRSMFRITNESFHRCNYSTEKRDECYFKRAGEWNISTNCRQRFDFVPTLSSTDPRYAYCTDYMEVRKSEECSRNVTKCEDQCAKVFANNTKSCTVDECKVGGRNKTNRAPRGPNRRYVKRCPSYKQKEWVPCTKEECKGDGGGGKPGPPGPPGKSGKRGEKASSDGLPTSAKVLIGLGSFLLVSLIVGSFLVYWFCFRIPPSHSARNAMAKSKRMKCTKE